MSHTKPTHYSSKMKRTLKVSFFILCLLPLFLGSKAEQCGSQAGGAVCPNGLCCSKFGFCGSTDTYCGDGCQSQCKSSPTPTIPTPSTGGGGGGDVGRLVPSSLFDQMLKYRNDGRCAGRGFYTYDAFIAAARSFNGFGTTGDDNTKKKELAAFLAQTSHETTGTFLIYYHNSFILLNITSICFLSYM